METKENFEKKSHSAEKIQKFSKKYILLQIYTRATYLGRVSCKHSGCTFAGFLGTRPDDRFRSPQSFAHMSCIGKLL